MLKYLLFLFSVSVAVAAEPAVKSPFPVLPTPKAPDVPRADPSLPVKLAVGKLLVVKSDEPALLFASPSSAVKLTKMQGPATVFGDFIDDGPRSRTFSEKSITVVEAVPNVNEDVELIWIKVGAADESAAQRLRLQVGSGRGAQPPPKVDPTPAPKAEKLRVLIVEDEKNRGKQPAARSNILFNKQMRDFLDANTAKREDGSTEWYMIDKDIDVSQLPQYWQDMRSKVTTPWTIVIADAASGKILTTESLPTNVADTIALCKRYLTP